VIPAVVLVAVLGSAAAIGQTPSGATSSGSPDASKAAVLGTGTFTAFVENMDRSLAFFQRHPIPKTESLRLLKKLLVLQTDFVDQLGVDDDALL
jgi:hypothetical protein